MLRVAFQYAVSSLQDQNYPGSNRLWIEQTMRKIKWITHEINNEKIATAMLIADAVKASDSTIERIRSTFGVDIADLVEQALINIEPEEDALEKANVLQLIDQMPPEVKISKLISLIIDVENYTNEKNYGNAVKYLEDRLSMIEVLRDESLSLYQQAKKCILQKRSFYRFRVVLS